MTQARLIAAGLALAAAFLAGWSVNGWRLGEKIASAERDVERSVREASQAARARDAAMAERNYAVADALFSALELERAKGKVITKEVIRYVERPDSGQCILPDEWVRLHEVSAGAYAGDPQAAGRADGAARAITDADVIQVVSENYQACREEKARLAAWQDWYREVIAR